MWLRACTTLAIGTIYLHSDLAHPSGGVSAPRYASSSVVWHLFISRKLRWGVSAPGTRYRCNGSMNLAKLGAGIQTALEARSPRGAQGGRLRTAIRGSATGLLRDIPFFFEAIRHAIPWLWAVVAMSLSMTSASDTPCCDGNTPFQHVSQA